MQFPTCQQKNATPLHRAIESGYFDIVQCLVNNKSVIDRRAIAIANAGNNYRVMNYLSVHEYSSKGHIECLIKLVTCYPKLVHAIDEVPYRAAYRHDTIDR